MKPLLEQLEDIIPEWVVQNSDSNQLLNIKFAFLGGAESALNSLREAQEKEGVTGATNAYNVMMAEITAFSEAGHKMNDPNRFQGN